MTACLDFDATLGVLVGWIGEPVSMMVSTLEQGIVAAVDGTFAAGTSADDGGWVFLRVEEQLDAGVFLDRRTFDRSLLLEDETRLDVKMASLRVVLDVGEKA